MESKNSSISKFLSNLVAALKAAFLAGLVPSCLIVSWYCAEIGFFPTGLTISDTATAIFLILVFSFAYSLIWFLFYNLGAPIVIFLHRAQRFFLRRQAEIFRRYNQKRTTSFKGQAKLSRLHRRTISRDDIQLFSINSLICVGLLIFISTQSSSSLLPFALLLSGLISFILARTSIIWSSPKTKGFLNDSGDKRISAIAFGICAYLTPLIIMGFIGINVPALLLENAHFRVSSGSIKIPATYLAMLPNDKSLENAPVLFDGKAIIHDATVYLYRVGHDAYVGLPLKGNEHAQIAIPNSEVEVLMVK